MLPRTLRVPLVLATVMSVAMGPSARAQTSGMKLWARVDRGPTDSSANAIAVTPDGSTVFVTGGSSSAPSESFATKAYNASSGATLWTSLYGGPSGFSDAEAIAVSPDDGAVFVTGLSGGSSSDWDYATLAYDAATGKRLWLSRFNGRANGSDEPMALGVSPDGSSVFATGRSFSSSGKPHFDWATVAIDASSGTRLWVRRQASGEAHALAISPDSSTVFVTGGSLSPAGVFCFTTIAYSVATGEKLWHARYNQQNSEALDIGLSPDGTAVFVAGAAAIVSYSAATGAERWARHLPSCRCGSFTGARALQVSPDGSTLFVAGVGYGATTLDDYATASIDTATGARRWVAHYDGASHFDVTTDIGVSADGVTVYVTGQSEASTSYYDYATVAYGASTGAERWVSRYNGPGAVHDDDLPAALATSPTGPAVFVTGVIGLDQEFSGGAYGTVAYEG